MPRVVHRLFGWYGAGPLHLLALLAAFGLAGYAAARLVPANPVGVAVWFVGALVGHDLVLLPLYSLADRSVGAVLRHRVPDGADLRGSGPWLNHLRVPAALSALLFCVFFPLILRLPHDFAGITDRSVDPYIGRWLLITGLLFAASGLHLALRLRPRRRSPVDQEQVLEQEGGDRLDGEPPPRSREQRARGNQPERER
ncbi:MAG: hypothetical protein ACRDMV_20625 [Streptosporangiales bacterium]